MRSALLVLSFIFAVLADQNTTIDDTNPSIQYSDGGHTSPCTFDADGNFLPGQPGCFNNGPKNCSSGAHILQTQTSTVSMQFKGSAIYMNALLDDISNTYTITLDGKSTDIDGVRPGGALLCYTLFSQTDLDPTADHNISLSIKGLSLLGISPLGTTIPFSFGSTTLLLPLQTRTTLLPPLSNRPAVVLLEHPVI
ncbi:hypothetical protein B0H17DRAFT_1006583 [Mycena rosella]|uniref:Uncharacterized protein n=1 Tax=Mycena rosella TaxID=1033263 RepID=A0AAD7GK69_MYCRO|nr:hypothetical protein B0H17DRAFT_1006583 [Mycena rosella]